MLGADREAEYAATVMAGGLGIGPQVLAYLRPEKILITRFIEGHLRAARADAHDRDARAGGRDAPAAALGAAACTASFSAFGIVETYRDNARWLGVELPEAFAWSWERAEEMRAALDAESAASRACATTTS